jgi:hypothetical protein
MPSASLTIWQATRLVNLAHINAEGAACVAAVPLVPALVDENLRAYVLLLAAHFQGFCRDLHTECAQIISSKIRTSIGILLKSQKPEVDKLPGSAALKHDLHNLNEWRNAAAHQNTILPPRRTFDGSADPEVARLLQRPVGGEE